jgi:hypothetical protein
MAITLSPDARKQALALKDIGPSINNRAIQDALAYLQERVVDLEDVCHEKEFAYWQEQRGKTRRG